MKSVAENSVISSCLTLLLPSSHKGLYSQNIRLWSVETCTFYCKYAVWAINSFKNTAIKLPRSWVMFFQCQSYKQTIQADSPYPVDCHPTCPIVSKKISFVLNRTETPSQLPMAHKS